MGKLKQCLISVLLAMLLLGCKDADPDNGKPSIFIREQAARGFVSTEDLQKAASDPRKREYEQQLFLQGQKDLGIPPLDPALNFPGRDSVQLRHQNISYDLVFQLESRMLRSGLLFLKTRDEQYKELLLEQIRCLLDEDRWPMWCDKAHADTIPYFDIRTGRIAQSMALTYNWLYDDLTIDERKLIVDGIDQKAIKPFFEKIAQKPRWYEKRNNWFTNIYGSMGITAMALGDHHPQSQQLLDSIVPAIRDYQTQFGALGEFNESPAYSGSIRYLVEFAEAYRYYTDNQVNLLQESPFPDIGIWMMYHTLPPGRWMAFGDTPKERKIRYLEIIAAIANANNHPQLQWFYQQHAAKIHDPFEYLWYNPGLAPQESTGVLPLGLAYHDHGASLISRTSWDPKSTHSVVYGKIGREASHDDNDVGQLLIDGFGERLIIDPGMPRPIYPLDYFSDSAKCNYYTRSSRGHNVLRINDMELETEPEDSAKGVLLQSEFDDLKGSFWETDLSPVYPMAASVRRTVVHLFPGIVVVRDQAKLSKPATISMRWHTVSEPEFIGNRSFQVRNKDAALTACMISLNSKYFDVSVERHAFEAPFNKTRQGDLLQQDYEPYVKIGAETNDFDFITLFAVVRNEKELPQWESDENSWTIEAEGSTYKVLIQGDEIRVQEVGNADKVIHVLSEK